ncbi:MAG: biliverdin-producing heme oxygenase [Mucilaginibacter sp.]
MKHSILADQLKHDTLFHHQQLEKLIVGKIKVMNTLQSYVALLQNFYSFFGGLEDNIPVRLVIPHLSDYANRRKTPLLEQDILSCGGEFPVKASKSDIPEIVNYSQAMGALYVIEGSSLGGQIISKMIAKQLDFADNKHLKYFIGYGGQTEMMWLRFKKSINDISDEMASELINTANLTFLKFKDWIEKNG